MQRFINTKELTTILAKENGPLLFAFLDKKNAFPNQQQLLNELSLDFGERLRIVLLDKEDQNFTTEEFRVHGYPSFIFFEQGKRKDVFLGVPDPGILREFVTNNMSDISVK